MVERFARQCASGLITPAEMVVKVFDYIASDSRVPVYLVPEVVSLIPVVALPTFREFVDTALQPDYCKPAWHYGGGRPQTEEERIRESLLLTARVQAWAKQFKSTQFSPMGVSFPAKTDSV